MLWLKTWLRKWLGVEEDKSVSSRRVAVLTEQLATFAVRVESLHEKLERLVKATDALSAAVDTQLERLSASTRAELIEIVKLGERDDRRISELETLVKDATLDTALSALEDRVAVIENHPATNSAPQGRRGGSAWNSHQVAAAAGAALANGVPNPIPVPGVS